MGYGDWEAHAGQHAVIVEIQEGGIQHPAQHRYYVRWADMVVSSVPPSNLFTVDQYFGHSPGVVQTATRAQEDTDAVREIIARALSQPLPQVQKQNKKYRNFNEFIKMKEQMK